MDKDFTFNWSGSHTYDLSDVYNVVVYLYHSNDGQPDDPQGSDSENDILKVGNTTPPANTAPVVTLNNPGSNPTSTPQNSVYTDEGATANDAEDGDITDNIMVTGLPLNTNTLGAFEVVYSVTDDGGLTGYATRTVNVVEIATPPANTAPVITIIGENPTSTTQNSSYADEGATANDTEDEDLTLSIITTGLPVNTTATGTYEVVYSVTDLGGLTAYATRTVSVIDPNENNGNTIDVCHYNENQEPAFTTISVNQSSWDNVHSEHTFDHLGECTGNETTTPGVISGYKFNDINADATWDPQNDEVENGLGGWTISLAKKINGPTAVSALGETAFTPILENAKDYFLNAFGTYDAADSITADAQYSIRNPNTAWTDLVQNYEGYGPTLLDLQVDSASPDWGNYNESHSYWLPVEGAGTALGLSIYDIAPENNTGALEVDVYEVVATTTTASDGSYSFIDLEAGDYIVRETNQLGWTQTFPEGDGTNYVFLTTEESIATNVNFGNTQEEIGEGDACGYKFHDLSGDGTWDDGEPALEGIVMKLFEMNGDTIDQTRSATTDENGRFCFNIGNTTGDNVLGEEDNGWIASVGLPQEIDVEDTDGSYTFEDVGNYRLSSIAGSKWYDENGDATWDEGENGIANWTITLTNLDTEEAVSTTTNESGTFSFTDLVPGNYRVTETMQEGYLQTYPINSEIDADYHDISVVSDSEITNVWFGNDLNSTDDDENDNGGGGGGSGCRPCYPCDNIRLNCNDGGNEGGDDEGGDENPGNGGQGGTEGGLGGGNPGGQGGTGGGLAFVTEGDTGDALTFIDDATTTASTTVTTATTTDNTNQLAAVGALGGLFGISWWWWILILILLGIITYYTFRDKEKN